MLPEEVSSEMGLRSLQGRVNKGRWGGWNAEGRMEGVRTELHIFPAVSLPGRNPPLRSPRKQQVIIRRVAKPEQNKSMFLFSCLQRTLLSPASAVPDRGQIFPHFSINLESVEL